MRRLTDFTAEMPPSQQHEKTSCQNVSKSWHYNIQKLPKLFLLGLGLAPDYWLGGISLSVAVCWCTWWLWLMVASAFAGCWQCPSVSVCRLLVVDGCWWLMVVVGWCCWWLMVGRAVSGCCWLMVDTAVLLVAGAAEHWLLALLPACETCRQKVICDDLATAIFLW